MASSGEFTAPLGAVYCRKNCRGGVCIPPDIIDKIKSDKIAWENYQEFSPSYKRIRVAYIDGARKRPEEFRKRLANFIAKTRKNKQIGFGGIEKYY